jgi:hypothetical protein
MKKYSDLTELEKIPHRIEIAKELALEDLKNGIDLKPILERCIEKEQYCGAEGIKLAIEEFEQLKSK